MSRACTNPDCDNNVPSDRGACPECGTPVPQEDDTVDESGTEDVDTVDQPNGAPDDSNSSPDSTDDTPSPESSVEDSGEEDSETDESTEQGTGPDKLMLVFEGGESMTLPENEPVGEEIRESLVELGRPKSEWQLVSRPHLHCERRGNSFYIVDEDSKNGTLVNGNRVDSDDGIEVGDGDTVTIARTIDATVRLE